jgi:hypothetical protein
MELFACIAGLVSSLVGVLGAGVFDWYEAYSGLLDFAVQVQRCDRELCPGSQFTKVGAAWANIGYLAHSDVLNMLSATEFGAWAPLLYVCAGIGALIGVAMNMPPKGYVWFLLGPSLYLFLIGTTQDVRGVDWVVANRQQPMAEVWRDAEVGLANLSIVNKRGSGFNVTIDGPGRLYPVATPLVFLDSLFSNTANFLVDWSGLYRQAGGGSANSNLVGTRTTEQEGPWYLLSTLKWGMLENIVGGSVRDPNIRDAFVTFLTSECGDGFKKMVDSGQFIAASQARGVALPESVMVQDSSSDFQDYAAAVNEGSLDFTAMPTPRSLLRIFQQNANDGNFGSFAPQFKPDSAKLNQNQPLSGGWGQTILCSQYLYTLVQAFRHEAGHAYWQLIRSAPNGMTRDQFLRSLFYGWNIRIASDGSNYASDRQIRAFVKHLILLYLIRNEMLFAPQLTAIDQRYAPAEQNRTNSEAQVRTMGSKAKFAELYNWAILMPYLQGILLYFVIMAYPFACMMIILPGHHKTFFTWISFFAWLKLWDVGFAFVQVLERSVWAMIGNQTSAAKIADKVINIAYVAGDIGVSCAGGLKETTTQLADLCAIPQVCSVAGNDGQSLVLDDCTRPVDQAEYHAMALWDRMLLLSASADLDLANGYYIYIMAALYMAVPAVTGQIVLGAKAGAANTAGQLFNGVSNEAGAAARTGYQHDATNKAVTNAGSLGQAAHSKALRKGNYAGAILGLQNDNLDRDLQSSKLEGAQQAVQAGASALGARADSFDASRASVKGALAAAGEWRNALNKSPGNEDGKGGKGAAGGSKVDAAAATGDALMGIRGNFLRQEAKAADVFASGRALDTGWRTRAMGMETKGANMEAERLGAGSQYEAEMAVWEAKNAFASHASAQAGIAGMNTGQLSPGAKPTNMTGMALDGVLGETAQQKAQYSAGFMASAGQELRGMSKSHGSGWVSSQYGGGFTMMGTVGHTASSTLTQAFSDGIQESSLPQWVKDGATTSHYSAYRDGERGNRGADNMVLPASRIEQK